MGKKPKKKYYKIDAKKKISAYHNKRPMAKLYVIPIVLSVLTIAFSDHMRAYQPLADRGCLLIVAVYVAVFAFEHQWKMVPYAAGLAVFINVWRHYQPTVFAIEHAAIWINIMVAVHLMTMG